jgi:hypothetical protein
VNADDLSSLPALIVAPADPVRLGAANRALERAGVPWRFGPVHRGTATADGAGIGKPALTLRYTLQRAGTDTGDTLARVGAEPWIVAGPRFVLVASPLDPAATSLPVSAGFVPWLADVMADRLSGDPGRAIAVAPTARFVWPTWADGLTGVGAAGSPGAEFTAPPRAGTYFFTSGNRRVGALVVNPEGRESTLDRWTAGDLAKLLGPSAHVTSDDGRFESSLFDVSSRAPVVVPLLVALLLVLIAEAALTARGAGAVAEGQG